MMGFRGSFRYSHPRYRDGFALECQSILRLRNTMGFKNTRILVPFCRTLEDAGAVIAELARNGLHRGKDGLEIHMMCEVPSNVILMRDFCRYFDGFSIGSNDLTQLILGIDRESAELSALFDERNPAVERMISMAIREARIGGRPIGICGQAPSDYPEFARFLVEEGIHGISLNPDSVQRMKLLILDAEKGIKHERERKSDFARNRPI
jgi:pyruvate,water dikinase